jgi:ribosomal protein L39E
MKRLIYRKGLANKYKVMKTKKQKSNNIPDWVFLTKYDFVDTKPYLEIDYFTLSIVILYEPYFTYYESPTDLLTPKLNIYRLYN